MIILAKLGTSLTFFSLVLTIMFSFFNHVESSRTMLRLLGVSAMGVIVGIPILSTSFVLYIWK